MRERLISSEDAIKVLNKYLKEMGDDVIKEAIDAVPTLANVEMNSRKLLPCPFCGGNAEYLYFWGNDTRVHCEVCGIETPICDSLEESREIWNKRTPIFEFKK